MTRLLTLRTATDTFARSFRVKGAYTRTMPGNCQEWVFRLHSTEELSVTRFSRTSQRVFVDSSGKIPCSPFEVYRVSDLDSEGVLCLSSHQILLKTSFNKLTMVGAELAATSACYELLKERDPYAELLDWFDLQDCFSLRFAVLSPKTPPQVREELGLLWINLVAKEIVHYGLTVDKACTAALTTANVERHLLRNGYRE